ncbi:hypothetical protein, partial [Escherichia coli]|uniref:hypothetical protein n=1 Tax=Escherichia coli TaxID=562 RepID=UPI001BDB74C4
GAPAPLRAGSGRLGGLQKSLPAAVNAIRAGLLPWNKTQLQPQQMAASHVALKSTAAFNDGVR